MTSVIEQAAGLATIGKTEEQLEAERAKDALLKKTAEWARLAEQAAKADPTRCQGLVYSSRLSTVFQSCQNKAKFHREQPLVSYDKDAPLVTRHFCAQHDEITKTQKQNARWEDKRKERQAEREREDRTYTRQNLIAKAVGHLSNGQLIELAAFLQTQEGFKKQ